MSGDILKLLAAIVLVVSLAFMGSTATANATSSDAWLVKAFTCIHHYEGAWNAHTGNGYYGGLQMDYGFMTKYGGWYLHRLGTADHWSPAIQIRVAIKAYKSGRGFGPWPNTRKLCYL